MSGPGQLSQRTDGGPQQVQARMSGMPYGENAEFNTMQSAAPMAASPSAASPRVMERKAAQAGRQVTPLFAPTARPDEPVTAGAPFGPGDTPPVSMQGMGGTRSLAETLQKLLPYDSNGDIARFLEIASARGW